MKKRSSYGQPGRPTLTPSALIWAFRRGVVLVQMLAAGENEDSLRWLAGKWGVPTVGCDYPALVRRMAEHCLLHWRNERD